MSDSITLDLVEAKAAADLKTKIKTEARVLKAFTMKMRALGVLDRFENDPAAISGLAIILAEEAAKPDVRELARQRGIKDLEDFVPQEKERTSETLQLICRGQPENALLTALEAAKFQFTGELDGTWFYLGTGVIADWASFVSARVQIHKLRMPEAGPAPAGIVPEQVRERSLGHVIQDANPRDYRPATITPPARDNWHLHQVTPEEATDLVLQGVSQEGPVSRENVIETVRRGLKLGPIKVNSRKALLDALDRLRQKGDVTVNESDLGTFYDVPGRPVIPRDRARCPAHLRDASAFAPAEIRAALVEVLTGRDGLREDAAIDGAAVRLGISMRARRKKDPAALRIAGQLSQLVEAGRIIDVNGEFFLKLVDQNAGEVEEQGSGNSNDDDLPKAA